jgi:hypothetical protein
MHAAGLMGTEIAGVQRMMRDPAWSGALAVALPEELAVEETLELVPRATRSLGRPLLAVIVNRSATRLVTGEEKPAWLQAISDRMSAPCARALEGLHADLRGRLSFEQQLRIGLKDATQHGLFALDEQLALGVDASPRAVVAALASSMIAADEARAA